MAVFKSFSSSRFRNNSKKRQQHSFADVVRGAGGVSQDGEGKAAKDDKTFKGSVSSKHSICQCRQLWQPVNKLPTSRRATARVLPSFAGCSSSEGVRLNKGGSPLSSHLLQTLRSSSRPTQNLARTGPHFTKPSTLKTHKYTFRFHKYHK